MPFILSGPSSSNLPRGTTCDAVIELRDVLPTLLDCAGLPVPAAIDGTSVLPAARGETEAVRPWLHGEHTIFGQSVQWLTDGHEKYLWWSGDGTEQLFDLDTDPDECVDLARRGESAERITHWRRILIDELAGREDGLSDGTRLVTGRPVQPILPSVIEGFRATGALI